jgi:hypothetical protein
LIQEDTDNTTAIPDYLRQLKTSANTQLNRQLLTRWAGNWEKETRGRSSYSLTPSPTRTILQLHASLHKALSSVIIQMRTGLRKFLFQRHVPGITNTTCECGRGEQTVQHVYLALLSKISGATIWERRDGIRERMNLREILNKPESAQKGGTLHDPNETPRVIWSYTGERDNIGQALSSLGITAQAGVRGTRSEEPWLPRKSSLFMFSTLRYPAA